MTYLIYVSKTYCNEQKQLQNYKENTKKKFKENTKKNYKENIANIRKSLNGRGMHIEGFIPLWGILGNLNIEKDIIESQAIDCELVYFCNDCIVFFNFEIRIMYDLYPLFLFI